ncbi:MAG: tryptophan--tRNA ligase [Gemmatimonadales bacterium]
MPRIFSGIQPSGDLHIGNWLGAVQNWVALQGRHECFFSIVDLHAITGQHDAATLERRTLDMAIGLLAAGIDPARATLFVQSHVPEHAELMWLLNSVTPLGELERMTQFKDKSQKMESVPAGIFNYPILMAADILLYRADQVPVGDDQLQHLELARVIARRWNASYGGGTDYLLEPTSLLTPARRILGLDGQAKMSKSLGNTIGLLDTPEEIWQKLRPAVTDPARVTKKDRATRHLQHLHAAQALLPARDGGGGGPQVPRRRMGLPRLQAGARGAHVGRARPHPGARRGVARRRGCRARAAGRRRGARPGRGPGDA